MGGMLSEAGGRTEDVNQSRSFGDAGATHTSTGLAEHPEPERTALDGLRDMHAAWKRMPGRQLALEIKEDRMADTTVVFTQADVDALKMARGCLHEYGLHHDALQVGDLLDRMRGELAQAEMAPSPAPRSRLRVVS